MFLTIIAVASVMTVGSDDQSALSKPMRPPALVISAGGSGDSVRKARELRRNARESAKRLRKEGDRKAADRARAERDEAERKARERKARKPAPAPRR